jgi:hypothetical protein
VRQRQQRFFVRRVELLGACLGELAERGRHVVDAIRVVLAELWAKVGDGMKG